MPLRALASTYKNPNLPVPNFRKMDWEQKKKVRFGTPPPPRVSTVVEPEPADEESLAFIMAAGDVSGGTLLDSAAQVSLSGDKALLYFLLSIRESQGAAGSI